MKKNTLGLVAPTLMILATGCNKTLDRPAALKLVSGVNLQVVQGTIDDDPGAYDASRLASYQKLVDLKLLQCEKVPIWSANGPFRWTCGGGQGEGAALRKAPGGMRNISYDIGYYRATDIAGITQTDNSASAQVSAQFTPSDLYSKYKQYLEPLEKGLSFPGANNVEPSKVFQMNFTRYDDGWRLVR